MKDKQFDIPTKSAPKYLFWLARIFGKTYKVGGHIFKRWQDLLWYIKEEEGAMRPEPYDIRKDKQAEEESAKEEQC